MINFDKRIEGDCGKEIYLNRTFTGVSNKGDNTRIPYSGSAYDTMYFGYSVQEKFAPMAFGTGIGDRKITTTPEFRWNTTNVDKPPLWDNGNWGESTLGGVSPSFWSNQQQIGNYMEDDGKTLYYDIKPYSSKEMPVIGVPDEELGEVSIESFTDGNGNDFNGKLGKNNNNNNNNNKTNNAKTDCQSCKKIEWDLVILALMLVIAMIIVIMIGV
jgi:hypothetical protein